MKLTRKQLTHARDVQLHAIGITRSNTPGWLKKALQREFSESEVNAFLHATKVKERPPEPKTDANVESVRKKLEQRAKLGLRKYGVTTERTDLSALDHLLHAQEEAMDLAVYLERLICDEEQRLKSRMGFTNEVAPLFPDDLEYPKKPSPEEYANELYSELDRDLL